MKDEIRLSIYDGQDYEIQKLRKLLEPYGIHVGVKERSSGRVSWKYMEVSYDTVEISEARSRKAGRKRIAVGGGMSVGQIRSMRKEMTAEELAEFLGMSRKTLYRRLKEIEKLSDAEPFF